MRGGEPVAAFVAIVDANAEAIEWACAGHPGASSDDVDRVSRSAHDGLADRRRRRRLGESRRATRGARRSRPMRCWSSRRAGCAARTTRRGRRRFACSRRPARGCRRSSIDAVSKARALDEDLLAIVVRHRADRPSRACNRVRCAEEGLVTDIPKNPLPRVWQVIRGDGSEPSRLWIAGAAIMIVIARVPIVHDDRGRPGRRPDQQHHRLAPR